MNDMSFSNKDIVFVTTKDNAYVGEIKGIIEEDIHLDIDIISSKHPMSSSASTSIKNIKAKFGSGHKLKEEYKDYFR